jgi:hypothetical protein
MMLMEPGSKIEGATEDVLGVLHGVAFAILRENGVDESHAYDLAELHAARMLHALTNNGFVVRQVEHTAWVRGRIEAKAVNAALMSDKW